jgi:hypothetical protein
MSAGAKYSTRYFLARVANALEAIRKDLPSSSINVETGSLVERFKDAYKQQMTTVMAFTGAAMAPALNPGWCRCCGQQLLCGTRLQQQQRSHARVRLVEVLEMFQLDLSQQLVHEQPASPGLMWLLTWCPSLPGAHTQQWPQAHSSQAP